MTNRELRNLSMVLILISLVLYGANYLVFRNAHDIFFYMLIDLGFLPLSVLIVTVVINRLLVEREKSAQRYKMHMVISAFFSATGTPLLRLLGRLTPAEEELDRRLAVAPDWDVARLREAITYVRQTPLPVQAPPEKLLPLREFLAGPREFMMRLLENPVLLEHGEFTDLLWAVFHLEEELSARQSLEDLPPADLEHLAGDADRALRRLWVQWLEHMIHLRRDYPFLFSFEARTNPLRTGAKAEIEE
jgi:hypothetical protein